MFAALLFAILAGPPVDQPGRIALRLHLGRTQESAVVRSELARDHEWFLTRRLAIEAHYRIVLIEDLYSGRPSYQIGTGDERHEFPAGAFTCSGAFMLTLKSVADGDKWDRQNPFDPTGLSWWSDTDNPYEWQKHQLAEHLAKRPMPFPRPYPSALDWPLPGGLP